MRKKSFILLVVLMFFVTVSVIAQLVFVRRNELSLADKARTLFEAKDYSQAKQMLLNLIALNPADEEAFRMLGDISRFERNMIGAAECFRIAFALNPIDESLKLKYVELLSWLEDYEYILELYPNIPNDKMAKFYYLEAAYALEQEVEVCSDFDAYFKGINALQKGDINSAIILLDNAKVCGDFSAYKRDMLLASALLDIGRKSSAEALFLRVASNEPNLGAFPLASFYISEQRHEEAIVWLERQWRYGVFHIPAIQLLAELYFKVGRAAKLQALIAKIDPQSKDEVELLNYCYALLYCQDNRWSECEKFLQVSTLFSESDLYCQMKNIVVSKTTDSQ